MSIHRYGGREDGTGQTRTNVTKDFLHNGQKLCLNTSTIAKSAVPLKIRGSTTLRNVGTFNHYAVQNREKTPSSDQIPL